MKSTTGKKTLNTRLLVFGLVTAFLFSAIFLLISFLIEQATIEQALRSNCSTVASRLSDALSLPVWNYDIPNIQATIKAEMQSADVRLITVFNEKGKPVAYACRYRDGRVATGISESPPDSQLVSLFHSNAIELSLNQRTIGRVDISVSQDSRLRIFTSQMLQILSTQLLSTMICIAILLMGVRYLIVRRIMALSRIVTQFTESGFDSRMPAGQPDEIGQLASSFNSMAQTISDYSQDMEKLVSQRTAQLVEAEKLAFLGSLVAGFAHELNTPLGIALTANTFQESRIKEAEQRFQAGTLTKSDLETHFRELQKAQQLVQSNIERTSRLVSTLKSVGIDQDSGELQQINLLNFLQETLVSLAGGLRASSLKVQLDIPANLRIRTSSSILYQIFSLLIMNSAVHAYPAGQAGNAYISAEGDRNGLTCRIRDEGHGIPDALINRLFTPFFTTRHFEGHVGLGLYIVYNAVKKLDGSIVCSKPEGGGLLFTMQFPIPVHQA